MSDELDGLRYLHLAGDSHGYAAYPDPGGLIPWGESPHGDTFFWKTTTGPDSRQVVVSTSDDDWWEYAGGLSAFLVGLLDGSVPARGLPRSFPSPAPKVRSFP